MEVTWPLCRSHASKGAAGKSRIAATFAGVLGVRLVASLTAAALGVGKLALSMKVLRAAIIRTGIGALIVGAGEMIYWFGRLVKEAGGFGAALGLLKCKSGSNIGPQKRSDFLIVAE